MFAGTAIAVGVWGVLQMIGFGVGLVALDPNDANSYRGAAIGTTAFSTLAPLIALFAGGWVAARIANTYDRQVAGAHGLITWGLSSVIGMMVTLVIATGLGHNAARMERHHMRMLDDSRIGDIDDAIAPINARLRLDSKPIVTPSQLLDAARASNHKGYDRARLIDKLDDMTALDEADATRFVDQLGARAVTIVQIASTPTAEEHASMKAMEKAGKGILALGVAMLLSVFTALLGAFVALRNSDDPQRRAARATHTTAPYPVTERRPPDEDGF